MKTENATSLPDRSAEKPLVALAKGTRTLIPYGDVRPDPNQPRKEFPAEAMAELMESIRVNGIQDALIVREDPEKKKKYMLVEGERRWRTAGELKLAELPVEIRVYANEEAVRQYQRIVGTQRLNLSLLEQARDFKNELDLRRKGNPKFSPEDLAAELGISRASMYDRLKLTRLTAPVEKALREGTIQAAHAVELTKLPTQALQEELLKYIDEENASVRDLAGAIKDDYLKPLAGATFDPSVEYDKPLLKKGQLALPTIGKLSGKINSCEACPHRTGNMLGAFPELKDRPNVCTLVDCYKVKAEIGQGLALAKAKADGFETINPEEYQRREYGYQTEEKKCWEDSKTRTWGELAKKANILPKVTVNREGKLVKVFDEPVMREIKKGAGIKEPSYGRSSNHMAAQKAYQKKKKEFTATAGKATAAILQKVTWLETGSNEPCVETKLWRLLAQAAYDATDISRHDFIAKRRGLSESCNESRNALTKYLKGENNPLELARFTIEVLLCAHWESGSYQKCGWSSLFTQVCAVAGGTPEKLAGTVKQDELILLTNSKDPKGIAKAVKEVIGKNRSEKKSGGGKLKGKKKS